MALALHNPSSVQMNPEWEILLDALRRLPLAALLGTALALRPRRKGTPARSAAVIQTQIVLSVVGAVIMLVVGASLARAFGIVGAASLIRYRSKIDDPKDAVVMLSSLSIGLACGVGLYSLSIFSTVFMVALLSVIESFEPQPHKHFALKVKAGEHADEFRAKIEEVLRRFRLTWELRTLGDEEIVYDIRVKDGVKSDPILKAIAAIDPKGQLAVEWAEHQKKKGS